MDMPMFCEKTYDRVLRMDKRGFGYRLWQVAERSTAARTLLNVVSASAVPTAGRIR